MTSAECLPLGLNAVKLICCEVPILLNNDLILISPAPIKVFALIVFSSHTSTRHLVVSTSLDETWHELFSWKFQKAEAPIFSFVSVLLEKCICQKLRDRFISYIYIYIYCTIVYLPYIDFRTDKCAIQVILWKSIDSGCIFHLDAMNSDPSSNECLS